MATSRKITHDRLLVGKLDRASLEDQLFKIQEENGILKTHGRKQEERIKKMAIKLVRLVNERKKHQSTNPNYKNDGGRDVDLEEMIEKQQDKINQVNRENEALRKKLQNTNHQLQIVQMRTKRSVAITPVTSKTSTDPALPIPTAGHTSKHLVERLELDNRALRHQMTSLHKEIERLNDETGRYKAEIRNIGFDHEASVLKLREQMTSSQKMTLNENIELIKLKRNMKEKSIAFAGVEERYKEIQKDYEKMRQYCEEMGNESEELRQQLAKAEALNMSMSLKTRKTRSAEMTHAKVDQSDRVKYLEKELKILQQTNERLVHSAFDTEQERQWKELERRLRSQISLLEAAIKSDAVERNSLIDKMSNEQDYLSRLNDDCRNTRNEYQRLGEENADLREKLRIYSAFDDPVESGELKEALIIVRKRKDNRELKKKPDFINNVDDDVMNDKAELQGQLAETVQDLNKTREMLLMQHKINKDYHTEVVTSASKFDEMKRELDDRIETMANLIDRKTAKIKKLESQLKDVAYGTKQFKLKPDENIDDYDDDLEESELQLERGENMFEINITKVMLNRHSSTVFGSGDYNNCYLFVTHAFYDFEMVSTPILRGTNPHFNYTSQYKVKVDDLFLHYLQRASTTFELHQAIGVQHKTIASCKVKFTKLLDTPQGRMHSSATLIGVDGNNLGVLDFWIRLRVPMEQAVRLYQERLKALGYIATNVNKSQIEDDDRSDDDLFECLGNLNKLVVTITSCSGVKSCKAGHQPNIYCIYKFFDFSDHDTIIVPSTNNPVFSDRQTYTVEMNSEFDAYLKTEKLLVYAFDDTEEELSSYLGRASIDLISLAHNKTIKSPFELYTKDGEINGTIEVELKWQTDYKSNGGGGGGVPNNKTVITRQTSDPEKLVAKPPKTPKKTQRKKLVAPQKPKTRVLPDRDVTSEVIDDVSKKEEETISDELFKPTTTAEEEEYTKDEEEIEEEAPQAPAPAPRSRSLPQPTVTNDDVTTPAAEESIEEEIEDVVEELPAASSIGSGEDTYFGDSGNQTTNKTGNRSVWFSDDLVQSVDIEEDKPVKSKSKGMNWDESGEEDDEEETNESESNESGTNELEIHELKTDETGTDELKTNETETNELKTDDTGANESETESIESETNEMRTSEAPATTNEDKGDRIRVSINYFSLDENTSLWEDNDVEHVFIEYDLLGNVEETPESIPKPKTRGEKMVFNYERETRFGRENPETRKLLARLLKSRDSSTFKILLISDPVEDQDRDCEEIGSATIDLAEILRTGDDIIGRDIIVKDGEDDVIGRINMSVEAYELLRAVSQEMDNQVVDS